MKQLMGIGILETTQKHEIEK